MVDACTIQHLTGGSTNTDTGVVTPTYTQTYSGKCKVQRSSGGAAPASPTEVGQASLLVGPLELHVPVTVTGVVADDLVTITSSALDTALAGRTYRVRSVMEKTFLTARRLSLIEVTS